MTQQHGIQETARLLKAARRVLFITGAGVSAESGVPTFRGATAAFENGLTEEGIPFEDVLSATTFSRDPKLSWIGGNGRLLALSAAAVRRGKDTADRVGNVTNLDSAPFRGMMQPAFYNRTDNL